MAVVGRDQSRGESLVEASAELDGEIRFHRCDLATQGAVRGLAEAIRDEYDQIDVLVHNAGLSASTRSETADGVELTFAVNHLAPYLLTHELIDQIMQSAGRVVVTASDIHRRATLDFDDLQFSSEYDGVQAYARSKLATIAFTFELAERLPADSGVTANCFHPGFVPSTNLFRDAPVWTRLFVRTASVVPGIGTSQQDAADRLVRLVSDPRFGEETRTYVGGDGELTPTAEATDPETRRRLWEISADLVDVDADWP